jgi:hypothetical protein
VPAEDVQRAVMEMESCEATCPSLRVRQPDRRLFHGRGFRLSLLWARRKLVRLASLKPVRRPRRQPVLPQGLTSLRPLITPYTQVGIESRQDGVRHFALHIR